MLAKFRGLDGAERWVDIKFDLGWISRQKGDQCFLEANVEAVEVAEVPAPPKNDLTRSVSAPSL